MLPTFDFGMIEHLFSNYLTKAEIGRLLQALEQFNLAWPDHRLAPHAPAAGGRRGGPLPERGGGRFSRRRFQPPKRAAANPARKPEHTTGAPAGAARRSLVFWEIYLPALRRRRRSVFKNDGFGDAGECGGRELSGWAAAARPCLWRLRDGGGRGASCFSAVF